MSKLVRGVAFMIVLSLELNCSQDKPIINSQRNNSSTRGVQVTSLPDKSTDAEIKSIEFFGWWWSEEQMGANFNADNPPPKNAYIKLEEWNTASDNDSPHPDQIDVVCYIENKANQSTDLIVSAIVDFKVESYKRIDQTDDGGDKLLKAVPWTEEISLGQIDASNIAPRESRKVEFKDFNLRYVLDKYSGEKNDDLWPWKLRVRISVKTPSGVRVAQGQAVLDLIPAD